MEISRNGNYNLRAFLRNVSYIPEQIIRNQIGEQNFGLSKTITWKTYIIITFQSINWSNFVIFFSTWSSFHHFLVGFLSYIQHCLTICSFPWFSFKFLFYYGSYISSLLSALSMYFFFKNVSSCLHYYSFSIDTFSVQEIFNAIANIISIKHMLLFFFFILLVLSKNLLHTIVFLLRIKTFNYNMIFN